MFKIWEFKVRNVVFTTRKLSRSETSDAQKIDCSTHHSFSYTVCYCGIQW